MPVLANVELAEQIRRDEKAFQSLPEVNTVLRFGYAAGTTHAADLAEIAPVIRRALIRWPGVLEFETVCVEPKGLADVAGVRAFQGTKDIESFYRFLHSRRWSFAIAPLRETASNGAKTDNKYREYSALGIAGVYSRSSAYLDSVIDGQNGLLAQTQEEWLTAIGRLVEDVSLRQAIAKNALADVKRRCTTAAIADAYAAALTRAFGRQRVLVCAPERSATAEINIEAPMARLEAAGDLSLQLLPQETLTSRQLDGNNAFVVVRYCDRKSLDLLRDAKRAGITTAFYWDDDLFAIPTDLGELSNYYGDPNIRANLACLLAEADWTIATTRRLETVSREFNAKVFRHTPGFNFAWIEDVKREAHPERLTIGYFGSPKPSSAFALLQPVLLGLLDDFENVELCFFGFVPDFAEAWPRVRRVPWQPSVARSVAMLAAEGWDIGIAPLEATDFYRAKTPLKYRDYGACRIAGVYSDVDTYRDYVTDGVTGLLVASAPEAWDAALRKLIRDGELRKRIAEAAHRHVRRALSTEQDTVAWRDFLGTLRGLGGSKLETSDTCPLEVKATQVGNGGMGAYLSIRAGAVGLAGFDLWLDPALPEEAHGTGSVTIEGATLREFQWHTDKHGWLHGRFPHIENAHYRDLTLKLLSADVAAFARLRTPVTARGVHSNAS